MIMSKINIDKIIFVFLENFILSIWVHDEFTTEYQLVCIIILIN